jgi:hypothetical protein
MLQVGGVGHTTFVGVVVRLPVVLIINRLGTGGAPRRPHWGQTMPQQSSLSFSAKSSAKHAQE